jgi:hypothetical protein
MSMNYGAGPHVTPAVYNEKSNPVLSPSQRSVTELSDLLAGADPWNQQHSGGQVNNRRLTAGTHKNALNADSPLRVGRVLIALPYVHCYKVQLTGRQGVCIATAASRGSHTPLGVKTGEVIPPNSPVLIWKPNASGLAYILCVLPTPTMSDDYNPSDMIQQGGNSGVKKVEAYRNIPRSSAMAHGWVSQSCGRPMDGTIGEYVRMSETGIGLLIDSFQTYLRVNEACGIWFNYFDNYAKLAGLSLNIMSYCEHNLQYYDEGELFALKGHATYPWEATGMYAPEEKFSKTNDAQDVQLDKQFPFALEDVEDPSQTPVYRLTEYTGYLGQGYNRSLMCPAQESGKRLMTAADDPDTGLFNEMLTLDGAYGLRSAKEISFVKYPLIPNPRRKRQVEDAQGDDYSEGNNYKFSGRFGDGGYEHKVQDWTGEGEYPNLLRPAGVLELLTRHYNWKSTHGFYYHEKDYVYPDEGTTNSPLTDVQFYRGKMAEAYVSLEPVPLKIDSRYNDVNYYKTMSFFTLTEDGSIVLGDGYGSQIIMGGGQIRLEASGDLMLLSGSRVVTLSKEAIIRAKDSVDISSSDKDVRLKAENNMQLLAGNGGTGGMLLQSKGEGFIQDYEQRIGEDVISSGITLLSKGGSVNMLTKTAYFRTGIDEGNPESTGDFVLDVANGRSSFVSYALGHMHFNTQGMGLWHSPSGQDINITESNFFGPDFAKIHGPAILERDVCVTRGGSLGVDGGVYAMGSIIAVQQLACAGGFSGFGDSSANGIPEAISNFITEFDEFATTVTEFGTPLFNGYFTEYVWQRKAPGDTTLLANELDFSYRDLSNQGQAYGYDANKFYMLETRWQQLGRMGMVESGEAWTEKIVNYQGSELYPWPGKINWADGTTFMQYGTDDQYLLFDQDKAKPREANQGSYEMPVFQGWKLEKCDGTYKL